MNDRLPNSSPKPGFPLSVIMPLTIARIVSIPLAISVRVLDPLMPIGFVDTVATSPVINLAKPNRPISVGAEMLVHRDQIWMSLSPARDMKRLLAGISWIKPAHDRKSRRSADGLLTVSPIKTHS